MLLYCALIAVSAIMVGISSWGRRQRKLEYARRTKEEWDLWESRTSAWDRVVYWNVVQSWACHAGMFIGMYLAVTQAKTTSLYWILWLEVFAGIFGVTAGAHRLWAHRAFKAVWPLRLLWVLCNCASGQDNVITWARDHRCHHKYSDTISDPHDSSRGIFYSHIGWLLCRKHPIVHRQGKKVDISDLTSDPLLQLQRKYYPFLMVTLCFIIPSLIPAIFWGEDLVVAYFTAGVMRWSLVLHQTWLVNSIAHVIGNRPYDPRLLSTQNSVVAFLTAGEGWHNYHHKFPNDYRAAELPWQFGTTTMLLQVLAWFGLIYDLKTVSDETVAAVKNKVKALHG